MADYTFPPAVVLVESTGDIAVGATGVLRPTAGGAAVPVFDLNGSPIPSIVVGSKGVHQAFMANIPDGVLDFGSVLLPTISQESMSAARTAAEAATQSATSASQAEASAAAAQQAAAGKADANHTHASISLASVEGIRVHDGTATGGARPTGFARVKWVGGTVRPTNMVTGDVWEHDA